MVYADDLSEIDLIDSLVTLTGPGEGKVSRPEVPPEYEKFFDPKRLRQNLLLGALYLATFEVLKSTVIDDLVSFFSFGDYQDGKPAKSERYKAELIRYGFKQHRDRYRASCLWLKDMQAVSAEEFDKLLKVRDHRNQIAHELPTVLLDAKLEVNIDLLIAARNFIHQLDRWWFENYHAAVDPDSLGGQRPDEVDFVSFRMAFIDHAIRNALEI